MKNYNITIFLSIIIMFSCNKNKSLNDKNDNIKEINENVNNKEKLIIKCENNKRLVDYYVNKGNLIVLADEFDFFPASEYFAYKKFGFVSSFYFGNLTSDSCSRIRFKELLDNKEKVKLLTIKKTLDSFNLKNLTNYNSITKHFDGVYSVFSHVKLKNMDSIKYNLLLKNVLKRDSTFRINGFWIVIDKNGKTKKIENYIKHSDEIDNYVKDFLVNYRWEPGIIKKSRNDKNKKNIEVRTEFILNNFEKYEFPQLPPYVLN